MSRTWRGSWSQKRRKLVRWSSLRRSMNLGQGAAGVGGELVEGSPSLATGMLSCRAWTSVVSGRQEYRGWIVGRGGRNLDEGRRIPKKVAWFNISKARERDALSAIGDEDLGFGGKAVAGEHIDQVFNGESWNARKTHQVDRDEGRRR